MAEIQTICPYCGVGCSLYVGVQDNRIRSITPSRNSPVNSGKLCIKGWKGLDFVQSNKRITVPLIKHNGKFRETSWDEAISIVAKKLKTIQQKYGNDAIAFQASAKCTNEENYLMQKLARVVFHTNNIDHCARSCHASTIEGLVSAFGSGAMTCSLDDIEKTELIFLIGSNPTEQHPIVGARIIKAVKNGTKLIVADPRQIQLVNFANIHLQHYPGTDVALLNGLAHVILKNQHADMQFINTRTEGFEEFKNIVEKYDPETVFKITGVKPKLLETAANLYSTAARAMIFYAMGITQHTQGTENVQAIANLAMLRGNVGREGTGVAPLRGQNNVQGACDVGALSDFLPGYKRVWDQQARSKFEDAWKTKIPDKPGLTLSEMFDAAANNKIKAMYIMGENPVLSEPNSTHIKKALENLEFLVVQDIFITETAQYADVILPAKSFAEKTGTVTNTERRIQKTRKFLDIQGPKEDWEILTMVAQKLKYDWHYNSYTDILSELTALVPIYAGVRDELLDNSFGVQWPVAIDGTGTKILHQSRFARGLGMFHGVDWHMPREMANAEYPFILTTGRVYYQWHTGTMSRKINVLEREAPEPYIEINKEDADTLKIKSNMKVTITSRYGSVRAVATVTDKILKGVVFMPFHYFEAPANMLTTAILDPVAKIPEFKVTAVKIERGEK